MDNLTKFFINFIVTPVIAILTLLSLFLAAIVSTIFIVIVLPIGLTYSIYLHKFKPNECTCIECMRIKGNTTLHEDLEHEDLC